MGGSPPLPAGRGIEVASPDESRKLLALPDGFDARLHDSVKNDHQPLERAGIGRVSDGSPGTSHNWLMWRRGMHPFAPLLFAVASTGGRPGPGQRRPLVPNPDDVPALPDPPSGFDRWRVGEQPLSLHPAHFPPRSK